MSYIYDGKTKLVFKNTKSMKELQLASKNKEIRKLKTRTMIERLAFGFALMFISLFVLVVHDHIDIVGLSFGLLFCGSLCWATIILLNLIDFVAKVEND